MIGFFLPQKLQYFDIYPLADFLQIIREYIVLLLKLERRVA